MESGTHLLQLGRACENRCRRCPHSPAEPGPGLDKSLENALARGADKLVITGLEPASDPALPRIASLARRLGFKNIRLESCGLPLADSNLVQLLISNGINEICISLPAADAATYGTITGNPAGFEKCMAALRNVSRRRGLALHVSIPVCAENAGCLSDIISLAIHAKARNVIMDSSNLSAGDENIKPILASIEQAVRFAAARGVSISLKGKNLHQAGAYSDGRLAKKQQDDFCVVTYLRAGKNKCRSLFSADFRLTYRCNQRCVFCAANDFSAEPDLDRMRSQLDSLLKRGLPRLCLEGGEPTLSPLLHEFLHSAAAAGIRERTIMTNAVKAADPAFARQTVISGANRVFVSLHGHDAQLSDSITRAPGSFDNTISGAHNFLSLGVNTYFIFVMLGANIVILPEYIRFIRREFGRVPVLVSMASPYLSPSIDSSLIPRYSEMKPVLDSAIAIARKLGLPFSGMEEQHRPPECALPGAAGFFRNLFAPLDYRKQPAGFVKPAQCSKCIINVSCPGVKDFYAAAHGISEIKPLTR